ncbi:glycosyl transferase family 1 [Haloactinospora alba]|uniref:Glycosyl transferase family 1 n=1 Tax=Haloactinospora alba TaxID=405555 RepID=A0A543N9B2_9ACTN|nr:glycosyltransferase [Haloactinospora alba]TQN28425.1 glycosyl transferase family 1 [Haloactinospora alba]
MSGGSVRPWVVVTSYPAWPSPYFAEMARHAPTELALEFSPDLDSLTRDDGGGVINLHRLKRLYRTAEGTRTANAAERMLCRLTELRRDGWHVVWTVHNLLPIDGTPPCEADRLAARGVLDLADTIITHTRADAAHIRRLADTPVIVAGWGGITASTAPVTRPVAELAARMTSDSMSVLMLGNMTPYKDPRGVLDAFLRNSRSSRLFLVGPCPQEDLARELLAAADNSDGRVQVRLGRIAPEHITALYRSADVALCPYRADGSWEFFSRALFPSSVATAVEFAVPVVAPNLPSIREITDGHPRLLYPPPPDRDRRSLPPRSAPGHSPTPIGATVGATSWRPTST